MRKFFLFFTLLLTALTTFSAQAGLFNSKPQFLKSEDAFQFSVDVQGDQLNVNWDIADGYYLYKKEISVSAENGKVGDVTFPPSELHNDEFFGAVEIFRNKLAITAPLLETAKSTQLTVTYQGCTTGFCYPPEEKIIALNDLQSTAISQVSQTEKSAVQNSSVLQQKTDLNSAEKSTAVSTFPNFPQSQQSEQDALAESLFKSKYAVFWFFLLGLGLAFTPCVLPMLPLLSAIVIGQGQRPKMGRAFTLSFVYVQGMALTYTLLGLIVAAIGLPFQVALQSPPVLIGLSILFVVLSMAMFGVFNLQLPNSLQNKLNQWSSNQKSGSFGGVFLMGMIAGLVASPCTSAPLSGALLYVAQSGDLFTGGITLYLLALGMGVPLILITLFGNKILPKSGAWMNIVKEFFGFILLLLPVILLGRVFVAWEDYFWLIWLIGFVCWLSSKRFWAGFVVALGLFFGLSYFYGNEINPSSTAVQKSEFFQPHFTRVSTYNELQQALATNPKSIAMLDLYADWCVACKEFEKYTFPDLRVQKSFENVLLLQVDMTKNSPDNAELMKKLNVMGLPTIIFFDKNGNEIQGGRVTGFMQAQPFAQWINQLLAK